MKFPDMDMSTRKGNIILFEDLLKRGTEKVLKIIHEKNPTLKNKEKVAKNIALGAIVFHDVQNNRIHDVVFDWDQALNFEGKSAPYLMYTYARARSILRKKKIGKVKVAEIGEKEYALVKKIAEFPDAVEKAATSYEPHTIAEYAYTLAQIFNEFYHAEKVIGSEHEAFRLALVAAFAQVLKSALHLLGIPVLEEM
jgi:arginyl-tRNA synthetase